MGTEYPWNCVAVCRAWRNMANAPDTSLYTLCIHPFICTTGVARIESDYLINCSVYAHIVWQLYLITKIPPMFPKLGASNINANGASCSCASSAPSDATMRCRVRQNTVSSSASSCGSIDTLFVTSSCRLTSNFSIYLVLLSLICCSYSLKLSGQHLTAITTSGSNATLSFNFYRKETLVTTIFASSLAQETTLHLQNNSLRSVPVSLFQAARTAMSMSVVDCSTLMLLLRS